MMGRFLSSSKFFFIFTAISIKGLVISNRFIFRKHDLVIVNHVKIREELAKIGMARAQEKTLKQVHLFEEVRDRK